MILLHTEYRSEKDHEDPSKDSSLSSVTTFHDSFEADVEESPEPEHHPEPLKTTKRRLNLHTTNSP